MRKKRGPLTKEELDYIRQKADQLSTDELAKQLRRNPVTIDKFLKTLGVSANETSTETMNEVKYWTDELHNREYWEDVKAQVTKKEQEYFEKTWVKFMLQFNGDVLYSEELSLKHYITLEILIGRGLKNQKQATEDLDILQKQLDTEQKKDPVIQDTALLSTLVRDITTVRAGMTAFTNEHTKLLGEIKVITKNLKADRADRVKRIENETTTFTGWMRSLEDSRKRKRYGLEVELLKMASEKAVEELSEWHEYEDGTIDQPFLTAETVKGDEE